MLKKKNIAMVMAAATVATSAVPAFAAVTTTKDMADADQKKEVMDRVKKALETTYTTDKSKLEDEDNEGKCAYKVTVTGRVDEVNNVNKTFTSYDVFEAYMNKMTKDDLANIEIVDLGHSTKNGEVVDWENYTIEAAHKTFVSSGEVVVKEAAEKEAAEKEAAEKEAKAKEAVAKEAKDVAAAEKEAKEAAEKATAAAKDATDKEAVVTNKGDKATEAEKEEVAKAKEVAAKAKEEKEAADQKVIDQTKLKAKADEELATATKVATAAKEAAKEAKEAADKIKTATVADFLQERLYKALEDDTVKWDKTRLTNANVEIAEDGQKYVLKEKADVNGNSTEDDKLVTFELSDTMVDFAKPIKSDKDAIVGFENSREAVTDKDSDVNISVKCTEDTTTNAKKVTLDASTLVEKDRLSLKGNEFKNEISKLKTDLLTNKEGKKIDLLTTKQIEKDSIVRLKEKTNNQANIDMYQVEVGNIKNIDSKTSEYTITVKAGLGYAYQNGYKITAEEEMAANKSIKESKIDFEDTTLSVITVRGSYDDVAKIKGDKNVDVKTVAGQDRYKTAVEVSKQGFEKGTNNVVLVGGEVLADGLTATPLASKKDAPILLTNSGKLNADTKAEIERLRAENVTIVGGSSSVSSNVVSELVAMGVKVDRVCGADRYETSLEVAKEMDDGKINTVYIAEGNAMADAMSISAVAGEKEQPILLTAKNSMNKNINKFIDDNNVKAYVIGGSVSKDVVNELHKITKDTEVLAGTNRYETNAEVLSEFNKDVKEVVLVNGEKGLVDALAAGAYAGKDNGKDINNHALVLVNNNLTASQKLEIRNQQKTITSKLQVGYGVASNAVKTLVDLLK